MATISGVKTTSEDLESENVISAEMERILLQSPNESRRSTHDGYASDDTDTTEYDGLPFQFSTFTTQKGKLIFSTMMT